jgi:hypothetical protein
MSNCLDGLVAYRGGCGDTVPASGLYIDDLPFLSLKNMNSVVSINNGADLMDKQLQFAQKQIIQDIQTAFSSKIRNTTVVENEVAGFYRDDLQQQSAEAGQYKGIQVTIDQYPYLEFYLASLTLQMQASGAISVKVYDLLSNTLLDTIAVTAVAGVPTTVIVNKAYKTNRQRLNLAIVYDSTGAGCYKSYLNRIYTHANASYPCLTCSSGADTYSNSYVYFRGIKISGSGHFINGNANSEDGTSGMSIAYSLRCVPDQLICNYAGILAMPLLYKWAANCLLNSEFTTRFNSIAQKKEDFEKLNAYCQSIYGSLMFGGQGADGIFREGIIPQMNITQSLCACKNRNGWRTRVP